MEKPQTQDELDERLGDLWSMSEAEQDRFGWLILAAAFGITVAFICAGFFFGF